MFLGCLRAGNRSAAVENGAHIGARLCIWRDAVVAPHGAPARWLKMLCARRTCCRRSAQQAAKQPGVPRRMWRRTTAGRGPRRSPSGAAAAQRRSHARPASRISRRRSGADRVEQGAYRRLVDDGVLHVAEGPARPAAGRPAGAGASVPEGWGCGEGNPQSDPQSADPPISAAIGKTTGLLTLASWLTEAGSTHVAMDAISTTATVLTMRLEDLRPNSAIRGVHPDGLVTVVSVQWFGSAALELTYKTPAGTVANELLYRHDETRLEVVVQGRPWSFDGDGALFRLVSEAQRIRLAHLFDPLLAVHTSVVDPLPHQITGVYEAMLPRQPLRFLLADDPGAGKTIMAGLLIKELIARGDLERCLIVCPGSLAEQWQDELYRRFLARGERAPRRGANRDPLGARLGRW